MRYITITSKVNSPYHSNTDSILLTITIATQVRPNFLTDVTH